ncbi:MAG: hypothetical protein ACM3SP_03470 [Chloroflexota bacterium]
MRAVRLLPLILPALLAPSVTTLMGAAGFTIGSAWAIEANSRASAVQGKISLAAPFPKTRRLPVFKNRDYCGATVVNETLLVDADGGVKNAVVLLRPLVEKSVARPQFLTLDNQRCRFIPHVQIATPGSELLLKNGDPILHTVHARLGADTLFNVGLPNWRRVTKRLDRAGVIRIDCDVLHTWMSAVIVVADTPYFALTDGAGSFRIDGLPAGEYELEAWHERLGSRRRLISIARNARTNIEVIYSGSKIR